jgi:hypothetical protein
MGAESTWLASAMAECLAVSILHSQSSFVIEMQPGATIAPRTQDSTGPVECSQTFEGGKTMRYTKPEIIPLAKAIEVIQGTTKECSVHDNHEPSSGSAYEADE